MGASFVQVFASHAEAGSVFAEDESATTLSSLLGELVNLLNAELLGDTSDSHLTGLGARDHLVGSGSPVVTAVLLGLAVSSAVAGASDLHLLDGGLLGNLDNLGTSLTATVSVSLSTDLAATVGASSEVASAGVVSLSFGMESLLSESSSSLEGEHLSSLAFSSALFSESDLSSFSLSFSSTFGLESSGGFSSSNFEGVHLSFVNGGTESLVVVGFGIRLDTVIPGFLSSTLASPDSFVSISLLADKTSSALLVGVTISLAVLESVISFTVNVGATDSVLGDTVIPGFLSTARASRNGFVSVSLEADVGSFTVTVSITVTLAGVEVLSMDIVSIKRSRSDGDRKDSGNSDGVH